MGPDSNTAGWGPYQFPDLHKTADGRLLYTFNAGLDSVTAYGEAPYCCISDDNGKSWQQVPYEEVENLKSLQLPNGERLRFEELPSLPLEEEKLPQPVCVSKKDFSVYAIKDIADGVCKKTWEFTRFNAEHPEGIREQAKLNWPHMFTSSAKGVLIQPHPAGRMRLAPDGSLWMPHYASVGIHPETGSIDSLQMSNYLLHSVDNGHTWDVVSYLPYYPVSEKEADWEGYNENDITFAPDGSMVRLIRTHVIYAKQAFEPMLITRSVDGGKTWSKPEEFDFSGVWPALLTLKCGVTLATYGRPGLFLRATEDPACMKWEKPIELIHSDRMPNVPGSVLNMATCSYTDLIPLNDYTAGLAYSDFTVKDENGIPRKTMMFRTITVA